MWSRWARASTLWMTTEPPRGTITSWVVDNVTIVMELEKGETDVTYVDTTAEYPAA